MTPRLLRRLLNPLRTISAGLARLAGDSHHERVRPMPPGLGYWPAAVALVVFAWLELVYPDRDEPYTLLVFILLYAWVQLVAAFRYGPAWYARGDGFEVYSTLVAQLCPIGRRTDGRLGLRNPLAGLAALRPAPGLLAVICVLLGSTAFDGLSCTRWWTDLTLQAGPATARPTALSDLPSLDGARPRLAQRKAVAERSLLGQVLVDFASSGSWRSTQGD